MKNFRFISLLLIAVFLLTACGTPAPAVSSNPPLRVEYTLWWGDHTMLVAKELGLFEKYDVQVEPVFYEVYSDALPGLAAGTVNLTDAFNANIDYLIRNGSLGKRPDLNDLLDAAFLP